MTAFKLSVVGIYAVLPLLLILDLGLRRSPTVVAWAARSALYAGVLTAVWITGPWHVLGMHWRWLGAGMFAVALATSLWRLRTVSTGAAPEGIGWTTIAVAVLALAIFAFDIVLVANQQTPTDGGTVELELPLAAGRYVAVNAGGHPLLNPHLRILDAEEPRLQDYRGEAHAIDWVALAGDGRRAEGLAPTSLEAYEIFGRGVVAPCAGRVIQAVDDLPDMPAPHFDRSQPEGNHVLLECESMDEVHVLLAHLRQGSLTVQTGDTVGVGQPLGEIGNTGNSTEPHLHIHAQTPGTDDAPLRGDPLPITIAGSSFTRNDILEIDAGR